VDAQLAAFLAFTALLVLTPGAATAVVVRNVLEGGRRAGVAAAAGAALANSAYALVAALGLAAALSRAPLAYAVLTYGGGIYLAYLGLRALAGAWRTRPAIVPGALAARGTHGAATSMRTGLAQGLTANLLNPPIATFYLTVVPTFLPTPGLFQRRYFLYAALHVSMAFSCHCGWATALGTLRQFWSHAPVRRVLETLTGIALLALAWRVVAP
jgi:threonine/homoserine/homoserine lactone efflux protein